ncbi:FliC/FljB family flagellin [Alcanivorax marinus]|uniref:Flagellin n=1 Tax=Alloalcanivorax marinus TaxID=1177169 RepID=A0A9Q3UP66_9GAMM|nr:FliC/FljB family flagellin [Alloalcanivorax marinus]MCC4310045.1 FliC/FljB family flagellin [Alloalcanivorax marinus]
MSVINTNITAMIGQQNLGKSQSALQTSMERLSSGLRINSAADDAAGQAIANRMTAQTTGLAQAQRNANDGISVAQTAEGALNQVNDNLQRIRELTVQAQNDTNSASDLSSIQDEIDQRLDEIDRISDETNFNGVKVLASNGEFSIQVGANDGEQITMNLKEITAATLNLDTFNVAGTVVDNTAATDTDLTSAGFTAGTTDGDGVTEYTASNAAADADDVIGSLANGDTIDVDGTVYTKNDDGFLAAGDTAGVDEIDATTLATSMSGVASSTSTGYDVDNAGAVTSGGEDVYVDAGDSSLTTEAGSTSYYQLADGSFNTAQDGSGDALYADADGALTTDATSVDESGVTTNPLKALDGALSTVDSLRSELGAMQNRFESAISNLSTTETNLTAARSRIEDADYAVEVSNMTRAQILQQAGTSVLAQANQVPQGVLSLLG